MVVGILGNDLAIEISVKARLREAGLRGAAAEASPRPGGGKLVHLLRGLGGACCENQGFVGGCFVGGCFVGSGCFVGGGWLVTGGRLLWMRHTPLLLV